ncbi:MULTISPECIES: recombination-associated protein RdgC [Pseudomonas]|uniref:recombination-associated protein RdgC n=1 Tax=Pseudomonas TaxID=286 RepID=UPI003A8691F8
MFFKHLKLFRLTQEIPLDVDTLEAALASKPARPCASQELSTYGFTAPFGKGDDAPLVHASGEFLLIATRREERILPGSVVTEALREKVEEIEAEQMRKVYKKERDQLKDDIIQAFLPRAFVRHALMFAAIAPRLGLIVVNTSSASRAEDLLSTLREVLGSLPVRPVTVKIAPTATMTDWVKSQKAAEGFYALDECELRDTAEDGGIVRCKRQDLTGEEIQLHLGTGKLVTRLATAWQDKLSFVLDDKLGINRLKFEDLLTEQAEQDGGDDARGQFDASFNLMMLTLKEFLPALLEALGGEELPASV